MLNFDGRVYIKKLMRIHYYIVWMRWYEFENVSYLIPLILVVSAIIVTY